MTVPDRAAAATAWLEVAAKASQLQNGPVLFEDKVSCLQMFLLFLQSCCHFVQVVRSLKVVPAGFPLSLNAGGMIDSQVQYCRIYYLLAFILIFKSPAEYAFTIPKEIISGSLNVSVKLYPTPGLLCLKFLISFS